MIYRRHLRQSPQPRFIRALPLPASPLNLQLLAFNLPLFLPFRLSSSTFNRLLINVPFPKFFSCHTSENSPVSPGIATDPKTPLSKSCICHTSETPRGRFSTFQPSDFQHSNDSSIYPLSFQILPHSFALFCAREKFNSFLFKRFRTLRPKPPGVGVGPLPTYPPCHVFPFNFQSKIAALPGLSTSFFAPFFHGARVTKHGSRATVPH